VSLLAALAVTVAIPGKLFSPAHVDIHPGDSVTWRNGDFAAHDVRSSAFASPQLSRFGAFTQRFDTPGTYTYTCSLHPFMTGTVNVIETPLPSATFTVKLAGMLVSTDPPQPGKTAYLQRYVKERFAWRRVTHVKLDANGRGTFRLVSGRTRALVGSTYSPSSTPGGHHHHVM
jgi:hypothetical protein